MLTKKRPAPAPAVPPHGRQAEPRHDGAAAPARTAGFTNGTRVGASLMGAVLAAAIACGPLALGAAGYGMLSAPTPRPAAAQKAPGFTAAQQDAGAYALAYVDAWLGASSGNTSGLAAFTDTSPLTLPQDPPAYRDAQVASISPASPGGIVRVVVAVSVQPASGPPGAPWPRRYYAADIDTAQDPSLQPVGLPAPTAGPTTATGGAPNLGYQNTLSPEAGPGQAVAAFLTAYLTGQGDITVVLTPGTAIRPISPAPYRSVHVASISSDTAPPPHPADGTVLRVLVQAQLAVSDAAQQPATYLIRLRSRAGRWEIDGLDDYPALSR